jgi:biopolymer transport protein ExbD
VELPQDEVQVQRDSQNQIVIKYLDGSGRVIFQVPSSQIVALQRAIEQALEDQVQRRSTANLRANASPEGVRNGH